MKMRRSDHGEKCSKDPVKLFISYSHQDADYLTQLRRHLKPLENQGKIEVWCDKKIKVGTEWEPEILHKLESAQIILLLISSDFLSSDYCCGKEMPLALERHKAGEVKVIPVIIKSVDWKNEPFAKLQLLPREGKPVVKWKYRDEAWLNVVENVKSVCENLRKSQNIPTKSYKPVDNSLPLGQLIPTPVEHPVGRNDEIDKVVRALGNYTSVVITGIAGVGKTTVLAFSVREIENLEPRKYTHICFYRIVERWSKKERLDHLLLSLLTCLNPRISMKGENDFDQFLQAQRLMVNQRVLLVVDNADDDESRDNVQEISSQLPQLVIAVTSRYAGWSGFEKVPLEGLSDTHGIILFKDKYKYTNVNKNSIMQLCHRVKGHPMMITHLALEARESGIPPHKLVNQLKEFNIDRDLARRFKSVFERLPGKYQEVLEVIGLLDTDTIRVDLLRQVLKFTLEDLEPLAEQWIIYIHFNRGHFTVHELIRTWCRSRLVNGGNPPIDLVLRIIEFYWQFLKERRDGEPHELTEIDKEWPNILGLLDRILEPDSEVDPQWALTLVDEAIGDHFDDPNGYIPRRRQMSSLLDESPSYRKPRVDGLLEKCSEIGGVLAARVEKNLGHFFYWRSNFEKAELLFLRARERYRTGGNLEGEAATTWLLGYLADDLNYYKESQELYEQGTRLAEQVSPPNRELVAIGYHLIGCNLYHQGRFKEAETEFLRAYGHIEEEPLPHLKTRIERRLALVALRMGRWDEAEKRLKQVKLRVDQIERPRDAARIARHLALLYMKQNRLPEAEKALAEALNGFEALNARRGIGYTRYCMAILRRMQGNIEEAKKMCEKSLEIAREMKSLYGLAAAHEELANIMEAENAPSEKVNRERWWAYNIYSMIGNLRSLEIKKKLEESKAMKPKLPENIKGILFDLMDTLAFLGEGVYERTQRDIADSLGVSYERFKWAWDRSRASAQIGFFKTTEERLKWAATELQVVVGNNIFVELAEKAEAMWRNEVKLYEGTPELLDTLKKKGFVLAVVSNGPVAMKVLKNSLGITSYLKDFLLSCEVGESKPGKLIYQRSLEILGLTPDQCIFVGDGNDHELDGANELGLFTIKINRLQPSYASIKNASLYWDLEVNSLEELLSLF